jgi:hypothetical protein
MSGESGFDDATRLGSAQRLLARLAPKSMPLMPGRGGAPSLTPQDIAAALGLAARGSLRDRLAVEVLCLRHWPEAFEGPQVRTVAKVSATHSAAAATSPVRKRRATSAIDAAKREDAQRRDVQRLEYGRKLRLVALLAARARRQVQARAANAPEAAVALGPRLAQDAFWEALARAILAEYAQPQPCPVCKGQGQQLRLTRDAQRPGKVRAALALCEACVGAGTAARSYKRRAKEVRVRAEWYRLWINPIHERELALLRGLERDALRQFSQRLGR